MNLVWGSQGPQKGWGQVDIFIITDIGHLVLALVSWR